MDEIFTIPTKGNGKLHRNYLPPDVEVGGFFSIDNEMNYIDGPKFLKFCQWFCGVQNVSIDLKGGFNKEEMKKYDETFIAGRNQNNSKLVHLLKWIQFHKGEFERQRPNFVTLRGLLRMVMITAYEEDKTSTKPFKNNWAIGAMKKNGTIYLYNILRTKYENRDIGEFWMKIKYGAARFEDLMLSDEPAKNKESFPGSTDVLKKEECRAILRTQIGFHQILYCAELDGVCVKPGEELETVNLKENIDDIKSKCHMIDTKTSREIRRGKLQDKYFQKEDSLKWWTQCVLGGVSNIIVGYRNPAGLCKSIENIPTEDLPTKYAKGWFAETGFEFLNKFLTKVQNTVKMEDKVYIFSYNKKDANNIKDSSIVSLKVTIEKDSSHLLSNLV